MRCKKHFSDHSSSVGVCATCLRDRLFSLIQAQSQAQTQTQTQTQTQAHSIPDPEPNPNQNPPPLVFPRSVSPYICRRKSDHPIQRFYSTPQLGPTTTTTTTTEPSGVHHKKRSTGKFNLITKLFRSRSGKSQPSDHHHNQSGPTSISTSTSSSSILSHRNPKGMSPEDKWETELFDSPARTMPKPSPGRVRPSPARSGIALCLSPLVRASPARHWSSASADMSYSGEIRVSTTGNHNNNFNSMNNMNKPHLSAAASFCANRSRKIADFGRLNRNNR